MREVKRELAGGAVEIRYYDDSDKLVDIRKKQPPGHVKNVNPFNSSSVGHEY